LREVIRVHLGQSVDAAEEFEKAGIRLLGLASLVGASSRAAQRQGAEHREPA
jgi:hypothetical protein